MKRFAGSVMSLLLCALLLVSPAFAAGVGRRAGAASDVSAPAAAAGAPTSSDGPDEPAGPDGPDEPEDPEDPGDPDGPGEPDGPAWPDSPAPIHFADVPEDSYYFAAVQWAVAVGVTNGTGSDEEDRPLFSPGAAVTRAQAVTFLWRAMGEPEPRTNTALFSDVGPGSYYEKAVLWAVESGIAAGYGNGMFGPDDKVTRGQMLAFLWRTMGKPGETAPDDGKPWYEDAERWAAESGCVNGTAEPYATDALCPRSDVVFYLWNAILFMLE